MDGGEGTHDRSRSGGRQLTLPWYLPMTTGGLAWFAWRARDAAPPKLGMHLSRTPSGGENGAGEELRSSSQINFRGGGGRQKKKKGKKKLLKRGRTRGPGKWLSFGFSHLPNWVYRRTPLQPLGVNDRCTAIDRGGIHPSDLSRGITKLQ